MTIRAGGERLARPAIPAAAGERDEVSGRQPRRPLLHWPVLRWAGLVWRARSSCSLANDPGRMFFETKLGVDLDPPASTRACGTSWIPGTPSAR